MVHRDTPPPLPRRYGTSPDGDELTVEPVETVGEPPRAVRVERLRRLALELRVVALEAELERAEHRRAAVLEQYEQILAERERDRPVFSWLARR